LPPRCVAITFDDGADLDYYDIDHPQYGVQPSFYKILCDFQQEYGRSSQPHVHGSSFLVVSPEARRNIAEKSFAGNPWMTEHWWKAANDSEVMSVYNHSWDHCHPDVDIVCEKQQTKNTFRSIDTYDECQAEVRQAAEYLSRCIGVWPRLFAYPWGESSEYLRERYFPFFTNQHHTLAAFGASGEYARPEVSCWDVPRFVSGSSWRNSEELGRIVRGAEE
jgi:peptidoglycan/xylan/chitin deacetylase (PgdA/CDA1 family)